jgi:hypothetical protein
MRTNADRRAVTPPAYRGPVEHYANCFSLQSERCFRMIQAKNGTGHAQHCPYATEWRGRFKDGAGKWHSVKACDGHRADLDSVQRIGGCAPHRTGLPWSA